MAKEVKSLSKLIIQIPCYNEAKTLPQTVKDLPKKIPGIKKIEIQVIDDGSTDNTEKVAHKLGVHHIIRFNRNRGLAAAFKAGVNNALLLNADALVNTDGDNQYKGADVAKLLKPIVEAKADVVIGTRSINEHPDFSEYKKILQKFGSKVVRLVSRTKIVDATSGFRAYNREALYKLNVFSSFSHCLETIFQAGYQNLKVQSVPVKVNKKTRDSRLYKSVFQYLWQSGWIIIEMFLLYRAAWFFSVLSGTTFLISLGLVIRFLFRITFYPNSISTTFWPTVVLAGALLIISFQFYLTGILASLISSNRKLAEEILYRMRGLEKDI